MRYLAYLFDLDGTVVDTESSKASAFEQTCSYFGGEIDPSIYSNYLGESWEVVSSNIQRQASLSIESDLFESKFHEIYHELIDSSLEATSGVVDFIENAVANEIKIGLVSSSTKVSIELVLNKLGIKPYFDTIVSQDDIDKKKPHPEGYLLAAHRLRVSPKQALVFEDTVPGFEAAYRAGSDVIAINHEFNYSIDKSRALASIDDFIGFEVDAMTGVVGGESVSDSVPHSRSSISHTSIASRDLYKQ